MKTDMRNTNVKNLIAGLTLGAACLLPVAGWAFDKSKIHAITPPSAANGTLQQPITC